MTEDTPATTNENTPINEENTAGSKESNKRGRKAKYATDDERKEARRIRQRNYYNRIKDEKRELLNLQALRRYYEKKIGSPEKSGSKNEKLTAKLNEIETRIQTKIMPLAS